MATFAIKSFDDILSDMLAWLAIHCPQITDVTEGSVIRSLFEGTALGLEEGYTSGYIAFRQYLANLKTDIFGLTKKEGTKSAGNVIFSRTVSGDTVAIPAGIKVGTVTGLVFVTTSASQIGNGNLSSDPVPIVALSVGVAYNVDANTIVQFVTDVDGANTVTNSVALTGGTDMETPDEFDIRFQEYVEGLAGANKASLISAALEINGIKSAKIQELVPPVDNVDAYLYVDDGSAGGTSAALREQVQDKIDGTGTADDPGYRACGINIAVRSASLITQNFAITVYVADSAVNQTYVKNSIITALTTYVNNLGIGKNIVHARLSALALGVAGVSDVLITTPAANVVVDDSQVARVGTFTWNFIIQSE